MRVWDGGRVNTAFARIRPSGSCELPDPYASGHQSAISTPVIANSGRRGDCVDLDRVF